MALRSKSIYRLNRVFICRTDECYNHVRRLNESYNRLRVSKTLALERAGVFVKHDMISATLALSLLN